MKKVKQFVKSFDTIAPKPSDHINFDGYKSQTMVGGLVSIFMLLQVANVIFTRGLQMVNKENPYMMTLESALADQERTYYPN